MFIFLGDKDFIFDIFYIEVMYYDVDVVRINDILNYVVVYDDNNVLWFVFFWWIWWFDVVCDIGYD